jgi:HEAT repeat protein
MNPLSTVLRILPVLLTALLCSQSLFADASSLQLSHWDQQVRRESLLYVQEHAESLATPELVLSISRLLSSDANCGVRTSAGETLATLGQFTSIEPAKPLLLQALSDPIATVRRAATKTLCLHFGRAAIPSAQLQMLEEDDDRSVRQVAKHCRVNADMN